MSDEVIQIGALVMSKSILDALFPLIGTLVGAVSTYLATRSIETRKLKIGRTERLKEHEREAISLAFEWVDPLDQAVIHATAIANAAIHGDFDHARVVSEWPNVISDLARRDLPAKLRAFLPDEVHKQANSIVFQIGELLPETVRHGQECPFQSNRPRNPFEAGHLFQ